MHVFRMRGVGVVVFKFRDVRGREREERVKSIGIDVWKFVW